jgi:hypothetical protein
LGKTIEAYFNEQGILVEVPVKPEIKAQALALGWEFDEGFYNIELETGTVKMSPSGVIIPEDKKEETIAKM